jgi:hypothetical protein
VGATTSARQVTIMLISEYYFGRFGTPIRQAEFISPSQKKIEIYKWNDSQTNLGVAVYATVGASGRLGDDCLGCEFFLGMLPAVDDIVDSLAEVAMHGNGTTNVPDSGDTITLACPLWPGTEAKSLMFTDGCEIIPPHKFKDKEIRFIQLVPLFDSELRFKRDHGEEALWRCFKSLGVPYWSPGRKEVFCSGDDKQQ